MNKSIRSRYAITAIASFVLLLAACASPKTTKEERSGATVRSLNYSAKEIFSISVERPGEPDSGAGGDALNPYSSGGMICCFGVPSVWRPDLKVVVKYKFYPEKEYRTSMASIPPYPDGKASQIWLIVHEDESAEAVVSHYGPSREEWPGKVKGYPVPSKAYRLKLWEEKLQREEADRRAFERDLLKPEITAEQRKTYQAAIADINKVIENLKRNRP